VEPAKKQGAQHAAGAGHAPDERHGEPSTPAAHGDEHATKEGEEYGVVRQRQIFIKDELDDIYLIQKGVGVADRIIFEGLRQVRDGDKVKYERKPAQEILSHLKNHAE
jgi:hypothetical protein